MSRVLFYACHTCMFNELMHDWQRVCVCMCMSVLCSRGGCMFCVTFPALAFSYLFSISLFRISHRCLQWSHYSFKIYMYNCTSSVTWQTLHTWYFYLRVPYLLVPTIQVYIRRCIIYIIILPKLFKQCRLLSSKVDKC